MNCQTSKEQISQLLDNELPQELLQLLFHHLGDCDECRNFFVQTKSIHDSVKNVMYIPAPDELDQRFAVLGMGKTKTTFLDRKISISVPSTLLSVGAAVLMTLFIYVVGTIQEKNLTVQYQQMIDFSRQSAVSIDRN